jgi:hypothetical protein
MEYLISVTTKPKGHHCEMVQQVTIEAKDPETARQLAFRQALKSDPTAVKITVGTPKAIPDYTHGIDSPGFNGRRECNNCGNDYKVDALYTDLLCPECSRSHCNICQQLTPNRKLKEDPRLGKLCATCTDNHNEINF